MEINFRIRTKNHFELESTLQWSTLCYHVCVDGVLQIMPAHVVPAECYSILPVVQENHKQSSLVTMYVIMTLIDKSHDNQESINRSIILYVLYCHQESLNRSITLYVFSCRRLVPFERVFKLHCVSFLMHMYIHYYYYLSFKSVKTVISQHHQVITKSNTHQWMQTCVKGSTQEDQMDLLDWPISKLYLAVVTVSF